MFNDAENRKLLLLQLYFLKYNTFVFHRNKVAIILNESKSTIDRLKNEGKGPVYYKDDKSKNGSVDYMIDAIIDYKLHLDTPKKEERKKLLLSLYFDNNPSFVIHKKEAAILLGTSQTTLDRWHEENYGPPRDKKLNSSNGRVSYNIHDIVDFLLDKKYIKTM